MHGIEFFPTQEILFGLDLRRAVGIFEAMPKAFGSGEERAGFIHHNQGIAVQGEQVVRAGPHERH